jgi:hypothetical protein
VHFSSYKTSIHLYSQADVPSFPTSSGHEFWIIMPAKNSDMFSIPLEDNVLLWNCYLFHMVLVFVEGIQIFRHISCTALMFFTALTIFNSRLRIVSRPQFLRNTCEFVWHCLSTTRNLIEMKYSCNFNHRLCIICIVTWLRLSMHHLHKSIAWTRGEEVHSLSPMVLFSYLKIIFFRFLCCLASFQFIIYFTGMLISL